VKAGKVYLVGAGPGAADLLTIRAARLVANADIVFYDALVDAAILDLAPRAEKVAVGKRHGRHSTAQVFINKRLVDAARTHAMVVRLKGGDPMMFGRAQEEIDALHAAGIEVEVVPGITAALAAGASLGVSLTRRGISRNVVFVTPRTGPAEKANDWTGSAASADTAVVYMGAREAGELSRALIARGTPPSTPVAIVENASLPDERVHVTTLAELEAVGAQLGSGPAVIVVGEVLGEKLAAARRSNAGRLRKTS
jgi:uroporphyrin-III C-methyltransferase